MALLTPLYGGGFWVAFWQNCLCYYTFATCLHHVVPKLAKVDKFQGADKRRPGETQKDAFSSLVKAAVWTFVEHLHESGYGMLYGGRPKGIADILYWLLSVMLLDLLHDTWFYWVHRFLHWKPVYKHVHYMHHRTRAPTAFTGYSFHVLEAMLVFANEIIVCFLFPIHMGVHRLYHVHTTLIHEGGHAGYEIAPFIPLILNVASMPFWSSPVPPSVFNTVQHHDIHHQFPQKHFSLYYTHWDRWQGTLHPSYDDMVHKFFSNRNSLGSGQGSEGHGQCFAGENKSQT